MTEKKDLKLRIKEAIQAFATGDLASSALHLLKTLGYQAPRLNYFTEGSFAEFEETFGKNNGRFSKKNALHGQWKHVDLLFQLTGGDLGAQQGMFRNEQVDNTIIESYLFFTLELKARDKAYTRTELSQITREVNKCFAMPAMLLFKHGDTLTLAVIDRRLHKREAGKDVLEKVTLIKDIRTGDPHRAHIEILFDLGLEELRRTSKFTNFPQLHAAWRKTLDTKELNKRFFRELSNWYFHAVEVTRWPADAEADKDKRNAINTIRLITRLMFVWFLREKQLVPDALFDPRELKRILDPESKEKSLYYKAILQNLFFATLNTEMGKRRFRIEADRSQSKHYFIHNVFRYERCFTDPKRTLKELFDPIPFLNGGLFECLDKQVETEGKLQPVRIDGFSDRDDNPLFVPDKLFFDPEGEEWDFSEVYGSRKARKEKVRGLIDILGSYKFTITENTPIEEEVALDPELLGKVFENLLANYNPETRTTARKQTGSFYTPREIVNYMVDESLIAYLTTALAAPVTSTQRVDPANDTETRLRHLLSYTEEPHRFSKAETEKLIAAIDSCKILDPACGSGAFPMGVLHKLVHVLHKLDPQNKQWKERQLEKAALLDDAAIRDRTIADIEDAFANNALDYGRKLYLIENGIYGVDIQPIAMQIAKLRFFISLIVDQRVDRGTSPSPPERGPGGEDALGPGVRANLGIRPLPNLETKFVAANTLMKLVKPKRGDQWEIFETGQLDDLKDKLKVVRHDYFVARTPQRKAKCREQDKLLREELATQLKVNGGFEPKTAKMLAAWDPYDQNASAPFFDPEWMFGLTEGFSIVIGNPPYVRVRDVSKAEKEYYSATFSVAFNQFDLFHLFVEHSYSLTQPNGIVVLIIPNTILGNENCQRLRRFVLDNFSLLALLDTRGYVFDEVAVEVTVLLLARSRPQALGRYVEVVDGVLVHRHNFAMEDFRRNRNLNFIVTVDSTLHNVLKRIVRNNLSLGDYYNVITGIKEYQIGKGTPPQSKKQVEERVFNSDRRINKTYLPELRGKNISYYNVHWHGEHISYGPWLAEPRQEAFFDGPRILLRQIPAEETLVAAFTNEPFVIDQTVFVAKRKDGSSFSDYVLLALLNSRFMAWYFRNAYSEHDELFPKVKAREFKSFPIANPPAQVKAQLEKLVEQRLGLEAGPEAEAVEREIDQVVYQLYGLTAEEIRIVEESVGRKGKGKEPVGE